jgi:hypothetical protein
LIAGRGKYRFGPSRTRTSVTVTGAALMARP